MATAVARTYSVHSNGETTPGFTLVLEVAFQGPNWEVAAGADLGYVNVVLLPDDQPAAIRSKMSAAVLAWCQERGYSITAGQIILPTFQKG